MSMNHHLPILTTFTTLTTLSPRNNELQVAVFLGVEQLTTPKSQLTVLQGGWREVWLRRGKVGELNFVLHILCIHTHTRLHTPHSHTTPHIPTLLTFSHHPHTPHTLIPSSHTPHTLTPPPHSSHTHTPHTPHTLTPPPHPSHPHPSSAGETKNLCLVPSRHSLLPLLHHS